MSYELVVLLASVSDDRYMEIINSFHPEWFTEWMRYARHVEISIVPTK
jgi:hypothetical protein